MQNKLSPGFSPKVEGREGRETECVQCTCSPRLKPRAKKKERIYLGKAAKDTNVAQESLSKEAYIHWDPEIFSRFNAGGKPQSARGKPAEASLDWKPIAHTVPGLGIEPGMHCAKRGKYRYTTCFPLEYHNLNFCKLVYYRDITVIMWL